MAGRLAGPRAALPRNGRVRRERGVVLILVVIGMVALIGMTGLALDLGLAYIARTNLQNALDAAALAGAQQLNAIGESAATTKATAVFHAAIPTITPTVELSDQMNPFIAGHGLSKSYVRVSVTGATSPTYFAAVLPGIGGSLAYGGKALAGPYPLGGEICDITPIAVCAQNTTDKDCSDHQCYGYGTAGVESQFAITSGGSMGPGNYGYLALTGNGANALGQALAGGQNSCYTIGDNVDTKTGANAGQVSDGLNTRFNQYPPGNSGNYPSSSYPGDVVTTYVSTTGSTPGVSYSTYQLLLAAGTYDNPGGKAQRRVVEAAVVDCGGGVHGASATLNVVGAMCLFLTQPIASGNGDIYSEIIPKCRVKGGNGAPGTGGNGLYKIVLYQSSASS